MSVALGGNLQDFGIAEVFQLIGQQRKTGVLEISLSQRTMRLAFDSGAIVWASPVGSSEYAVLGEQLVRSGLITNTRLEALVEESESSARHLPALLVATGAVTEEELEETTELLTRETIFEVLRWSEGSFHFSAQSVNHDRPRDSLLAAEQILMDGLRMLDEWRTFVDRVPADDVVFQQSRPLDVYRHRVQGEARQRLPQAERIYQLVDGRLNARRIIDLSRLGTFEATRVLAELSDARAISPINSAQPRKTIRSDRGFKPMVEQVGHALAAAFPLAFLCLMIALTFGMWIPSKAQLPGFPIERSSLAEARHAFEKLRLRNVVHQQRFLTGEWPETLARLDGVDEGGTDALTPSVSESYYYARSEDGILLLAPER
jgi:hypothetical protein